MRRRSLAVVAILVLLVGSLIPSAALAAKPTAKPHAAAPAVKTDPALKNPKADSHVAALIESNQKAGAAAAITRAKSYKMAVVDDRVRLVVKAKNVAGARAFLTGEKIKIEATSANLIQILVSPSQLAKVVADSNVSYVREPLRPKPAAITDEAVLGTNASAWQSGGNTGAGVKIAIVDLGFVGLADSQSSGDLPSSLTTLDYCDGNFDYETVHGTATAEMAHKMASSARPSSTRRTTASASSATPWPGSTRAVATEPARTGRQTRSRPTRTPTESCG